MTLVARFSLDGLPFLIGDILLSEQLWQTSQLQVPTVGSVSRILQSRTGRDLPLGTPTALTQKLHIIGRNLAIGWSGNSEYAKNLICRLTATGQHDAFTRETLTLCFERISNVMWDEDGIRAVGLLIEGDKVHHFSMGSNVVSCSEGGYEYRALVGSGQDDARRAMDLLANALRYEVIGLDESSSAMCRCLALIGQLLAEELRTGGSLLNLFGAAYEIVIPWHDGRFLKFDDVTYIFWILEKEPSRGWVLSLVQATKNTYVGDFLVVRTVPFRGKWKTGAKLSLDVVTPVHNRNWIPPSTDWLHELPSFNSTYVCHCVTGVSEPHNGQLFVCVNKLSDPMEFCNLETGGVSVKVDLRKLEFLRQLVTPHLDGDVLIRVPA